MMKYYLPDEGETVEDARKIPGYKIVLDVPWEMENFARAAGEKVFEDEGGPEINWPIRIAVIHEDEDIREEKVYLVECIPEPMFYASELRNLANHVAGCHCQACQELQRQVGIGHASDCAVHNEEAYPNGPCDCGEAK